MSDSYNLQHIEGLQGIPNADAVIERIDLAARTATVFLRQYGMTLPGGVGVPVLDEVDVHLRRLVSDAIDSFQQAVGDNPQDEVDGVAGDEMFDVWVESAAGITGHFSPPLRVRIAMWLC